MKKLYHKYCKELAVKENGPSVTDMAPHQEYARQREYLERTVTSLRKKQLKDQSAHRQDNVRIMQENVSLITEINHLRKDIANVKHKESALESALKLNNKVGSIIKLPDGLLDHNLP